MSALHRFLVEFDLDAPGLPRGAWPLLGREALPATLPPDEEPESGPDLDFDFDSAPVPPAIDEVAEAVAAAVAEAEAGHAAALADLAARHESDLVEARAQWAAEAAAPLAEGFRAGFAALEEALAEGAGAVLEPFVGESLRAVAVAELRAAVADLVLAGIGGRMAVTGPEDLLHALRAALDAAGVPLVAMDFTPSEAAEVSVTADSSGIETRLGAWTRDLQRRLGEPS